MIDPTFDLPDDALSIVRSIMRGQNTTKAPEKLEEKKNTYVPSFGDMTAHMLAHTSELHQRHFAPVGSNFHSEFKKYHPEVHERVSKAFGAYRDAIDAAVKATHKTRPLKEELEKIIEDFKGGTKALVEKKLYHHGFGFGDVMVESDSNYEIMFEHGIETVAKTDVETLDQLTEASVALYQVDTPQQAMALATKYHEKAKKAQTTAGRKAAAAIAARYYRKARTIKQGEDSNLAESVVIAPEVVAHVVEIATMSLKDIKTGFELVSELYGEDAAETYLDKCVDLGTLEESLAAMRRRHKALNSTPANDDSAAPEADLHIVHQLRKSVSLRGEKDVKFNNGDTHKVPEAHARRALELYGKAKKPDDRDKIHKSLASSHASFKQAIGESTIKEAFQPESADDHQDQAEHHQRMAIKHEKLSLKPGDAHSHAAAMHVSAAGVHGHAQLMHKANLPTKKDASARANDHGFNANKASFKLNL